MGSSKKLFEKFKDGCEILVETGTWTGDGIQCALDAGYKKVYSCDINQEKVENARIRFRNKDVTIFSGPSTTALKKIFAEINERCVIFLDGHSMPFDPLNPSLGFGMETVKNGIPACPLLEELDIIKNHAIKDHIILIDDFQCFGTWVFGGITFDQVLEKVTQINPKYTHQIFKDVAVFKVGEISGKGRISIYYDRLLSVLRKSLQS